MPRLADPKNFVLSLAFQHAVRLPFEASEYGSCATSRPSWRTCASETKQYKAQNLLYGPTASMAAASCGGSIVTGCWIESSALHRNACHYEKTATAHSGLHPVRDRNSNYGVKSDAFSFRMSDAATNTLYRCLSASIRRLCEDLQAGASAYGYLDPARTFRPVTVLSREQQYPRGPWTSGLQRSVLQDKASAACSDLSSSTSMPKESATVSPAATFWRSSASARAGACVAGVASVAAGGAAIVFRGGKVAHLVIAVPVTATLAMAACWFVAWGFLEFTAHRSTEKLSQLLTNLRLQYRLAKEAVR